MRCASQRKVRFASLRCSGSATALHRRQQAVTGHKDLRMLKRYYHPRVADLAKKMG